MDSENIFVDVDHYDWIDYYDDDNIFWPNIYRIPKKYIRDAENPFEMCVERFQKRFRFNQDSVFYITSLIRNDLKKVDNRGLPISPEIAVLVTLRFYATASFQVSK